MKRLLFAMMKPIAFALIMAALPAVAQQTYQGGPGIAIVPPTIMLSSSVRDLSQAGGPILPGDDSGVVVLGAFLYTLQDAVLQPRTTWSACFINLGPTYATIQTKTSRFLGATGIPMLTVPHNAWACVQIYGSDYLTFTKLGAP